MKYKLSKRGIRMIPLLLLILILLAGLSLSHCSNDQEDQLIADVDSFSMAYFNWRFTAASRYCTDSSSTWLRYAASQVTEEDVQALRMKEEGASCKHADIQYGSSDSTAVVKVKVKNFLPMDSIENNNTKADTASFLIPVVLHQGRWLVQLKALPREM